MRGKRRAAVAGALALAVVLGMGSLAWACVGTDGPYVTDPQPNKAPAGTEVSLSGGKWAPGEQVSVGWSSDGQQVSRQLATAVTDGSGSFKAKVTVPEAGAGVHYLVVSQGRVSKATAFEVTAPARGTSPSSDPAASGGTEANAGTSPSQQPSGGSQPTGNPESNTPGSSPRTGPSGSVPSEPAPQSNGAPAPAGAPALEPAPATSRAGAPAAALDSGPLAGRTLAPGQAVRSQAAPASVTAAAKGDDAAAQASSESAFNDAWPAFQGGSSFRDAVRAPASTGGQGSSSGMAVALLGLTLGLMALSSGFGVAEASRRRAVARR